MYERLTRRVSDGMAYTKIPLNVSYINGEQMFTGFVADHLAAYEDSGLPPEEIQELVKAKIEGRLIILPCKVGDTVYVIVDSVDKPYIKQDKVISFELWNKNGIMSLFARSQYGFCEFGKTVFLTCEEAEKALEGEEKRTLNEWAAMDGINILDPDGFDRTDPHLFERLFTREEYNQGIVRCTIMGKEDGKE